MNEFDTMIDAFIQYYDNYCKSVENPELFYFVVDPRGFIKVHSLDLPYHFRACVQLWDEQTVRKVAFYDNENPILQEPFAHGMENLNFDQCFTYIQDGFHHLKELTQHAAYHNVCLLYTSPSPRDLSTSRMPSSA